MSNVIVTTGTKLPQIVVSNGLTTSNEFTDPSDILLSDSSFAQSATSIGSASDITVGNFGFAIPSDAVIVGFEISIIGKRGAQTVPAISVLPYAVDDTSGSNVYYPYTASYTGLTTINATHVLGTPNYLFDRTWTATEANNLKLQLVSNGDISIDTVLVNVYYYVPVSVSAPSFSPTGSVDDNSPIQVQEMFLELPFLASETKFYLKAGSFAYADGTPVKPGDVGTTGGTVDFVFDEGKRKKAGQNFAENVVCDTSTGTWTVLSSGVIEVDIFAITNRGRQFHTPYAHDINLVSNHDANSKVVISNNGLFYSRFIRRDEENFTFSPPIDIEDEGVSVVTAVNTFDFQGDGVQAEQDASDPRQVNVSVIGNATTLTPTVEDATTGTTGATPATTLTISHVIVSANYLRVWISTDDETISGVTYNGVAMTLVVDQTNAGADLKVALYGLVSPTVGTHDIVVTMAGASNISAGGVAFLNVDITNPTDGTSAGANGLGTSPTDSVTTTEQATIAQDVVGTVQNATTFAQLALWNIDGQVNAADRPGASSSRKVLVPGAVTDLYTISPSSDWAIIIAGVRGAANPFVSDDVKFKVSSADTTSGYGEDKIVGGANVTITKLNPGVNEQMSISVPAIPTTVVTVTDDSNGVVSVDNTDPENPVINFDGVNTDATLTGDGSSGSPLSAVGGGSGNFTVNADETVFAYNTVTWSPQDFEDECGGTSLTGRIDGFYEGSHNGSVVFDKNISGTTYSASLTFGAGKIYRFKMRFAPDGPNGNASSWGFGFMTSVSSSETAIGHSAKFIVNTDSPRKVYAVNADGTTNTNTNITASITVLDISLYEIVVNGTTDIKYYVDGVLVATHTTNLPTTGTSNVVFYASLVNHGYFAGVPTVSYSL